MLTSSTSPLPPPPAPTPAQTRRLVNYPNDFHLNRQVSLARIEAWVTPPPPPKHIYTDTCNTHAHAHTPGLRRRKGGNTRSRNEGEMGRGGQGSQRGWSHLLTSETGWAQACGTEWTTSSWPLAMSLSLEESREINWPCLLAL